MYLVIRLIGCCMESLFNFSLRLTAKEINGYSLKCLLYYNTLKCMCLGFYTMYVHNPELAGEPVGLVGTKLGEQF